ncbi:conserved hypothetical protein [Frankia sp. AiPs1]|uniref:hypothetical protein n=1 Tax=Frankia sp. AiPa1 TaxID=573492 RepID=UPI00202B7902|nr:hypothetical protein [Frankia sp. AiPa1]MCL9758994.1 hypothetical protein [Frankia sp. AiPa1]
MLSDLRTAGAASLAPAAGLFLPELHHRRDIGLDLVQVNGIADLCHSYTQKRATINLQMTRLAGELLAGILSGKVCDDRARDVMSSHTETRGILFGDAETLILATLAEGYALLSTDQVERALAVRRGQTSAAFDAVADAMYVDQVAPTRL